MLTNMKLLPTSFLPRSYSESSVVKTPVSSPTSVVGGPPVFADVEKVLREPSDKEARAMLTDMVMNLLSETDSLQKQAAQHKREIANLKDELQSHSKNDEQNWNCIMEALQQKTGTSIVNPPTDEPANSTQAAILVVQSLLSKVEVLTEENCKLKSLKNNQDHKLSELALENEAYVQKIEALESQFTKINKTRQKVVTRIIERKDHEVRGSRRSMLAEV
jgi:DNA repair exonuclease SbcCD ATPase subunit